MTPMKSGMSPYPVGQDYTGLDRTRQDYTGLHRTTQD